MALALHWLFLFGFWLVLSGVFDAKHIGLGVVLTAAVALHARPMEHVAARVSGGDLHLSEVPWLRVGFYSMWLLREIIKANIQVVRVVLDPALPIEPAMVRVPTRVRSDTGITLLANSITATPGTITVRAGDANEGEFLVHALLAPQSVVPEVRRMEDYILRAMGRLEARPIP